MQAQHPSLLQNFHEFDAQATGKRVAVFLDYDGALHLMWICHLAALGDDACQCQLGIDAVRSVPKYSIYPLRIGYRLNYEYRHDNPVLLAAGTLTPIVKNPDRAYMSDQVRSTLPPGAHQLHSRQSDTGPSYNVTFSDACLL